MRISLSKFFSNLKTTINNNAMRCTNLTQILNFKHNYHKDIINN